VITIKQVGLIWQSFRQFLASLSVHGRNRLCIFLIDSLPGQSFSFFIDLSCHQTDQR